MSWAAALQYGRKASMTQPGVPDSADWQRRWTIDAGGVTLLPVTRRMAQDVLDGGPVTRRFEEGALHDRDSASRACLPARMRCTTH